MPSKSYTQFQKNLETVNRLEETYYEIKKQKHNKGGRGAFDHITRSAVIFLISAFEVYCESLICEVAGCLAKEAKDAKNLPHDVRATICDYTRNEKNGTSPLELCDEGWRTVYKSIVEQKTGALNTPKTDNLKALFKDLVGIKPKVIENIMQEKSGKNILDPIIVFRGEITHKVTARHYVHIETVENCKEAISRIVVEMEKKTCDYLKNQSMEKKQPWRKTYTK